jgi:hypothetical protein
MFDIRCISDGVDFVRVAAQGIDPGAGFSTFTRRFSMKKIMLSVIAVMCVVGFGSLSFAEDMGKMKDEMKGEMKEMKGDMKGDMKGEMKGKMKAKHDEMKGEMKEMKGEMKGMKDEMKGEMKGAMGK